MDKHIEALIELNGKFERLIENIQTVREKQEEMADGISKIKEVVYKEVYEKDDSSLRIAKELEINIRKI